MYKLENAWGGVQRTFVYYWRDALSTKGVKIISLRARMCVEKVEV